MASPFAVLGRSGGGTLRSRSGRPLRNHGGNLAAPPVVVTPTLFDTARLLEWQGSNNESDNFGQARDWAMTLNGPQHRLSFVRYQPTWRFRLRDAFPQWQPATVRVDRIRRKGTTGGEQRVMVFDCEHNTNPIRAGDKVWLYLVGPDWGPYEGGASAATSLQTGQFAIPLKSLLTVTGCVSSPDQPADSPSQVEVTFAGDLPAIDYAPPTFRPYQWAPDYQETRLLLVHHSFYADEATKRLRYPLSWHLDIFRFQVLPNGGSGVVGGSRNIPTWADWTHFANSTDATLAWELYAKEQTGLAETLGDLDPRRLANELEDKAATPWTDEEARANTDLPDPQAAIGLRRSLVERMMPLARAAWGNERTMIVKPGGSGTLDKMHEWDIDNDATWGGLPNVLGNRDFTHIYAPRLNANGRQLRYEDRADCDYHAGVLADTATAWKLKSAIVTEFGAPNTETAASRGLSLGRFHTACAARGIPVGYWDLVGGLFAASGLYNNVPGSEGVVVQALIPELRAYCGRAGRSV